MLVIDLNYRNVYKESVVSEARRVGPILVGLKSRIEELLAEWPDHPSLVQVDLHHHHIAIETSYLNMMCTWILFVLK